jgi:hypothetical protein
MQTQKEILKTVTSRGESLECGVSTGDFFHLIPFLVLFLVEFFKKIAWIFIAFKI